MTKGHTFLSDEVVTPEKLNALVDDAELDPGEVTESKIADGAVTESKIGDGEVSAAKLESIIDLSAKSDFVPPTGAFTGRVLVTPADADLFLIKAAAGVRAVTWAVIAAQFNTPGTVRQTVSTKTAEAVISHPESINVGASAPLVTEGWDLMEASITPGSVSNKVLVRVSVPVVTAAAAGDVVFALFRGSTCIGVTICYCGTAVYGTTQNGPVCLEVMDAPAATTAQVYQLRMGKRDTSGWVAVNGTVTTGGAETIYFGGKGQAQMILQEIRG